MLTVLIRDRVIHIRELRELELDSSELYLISMFAGKFSYVFHSTHREIHLQTLPFKLSECIVRVRLMVHDQW